MGLQRVKNVELLSVGFLSNHEPMNLKVVRTRRNPTADTPRGCCWDLSNTSICALDSVIWPKDALFMYSHHIVCDDERTVSAHHAPEVPHAHARHP